MSNAVTTTPFLSDAQVLAQTVIWLERAVIGLNLCPFAKGVHVKKQIHYAICHSVEPTDLLETLATELITLQALDPQQRDTSLLIAPWCMPDFWEFNDFQARANKLLRKTRLEGVIQIASFHPDFQFAGTDANDIGNYTNRAPFPILHLIREESIARAVEAFPSAEMIFEKNIETLQALGEEGWHALGCSGRGKITP